MKILLLQNMLYVPALGGANKGNRELMERLAANGHTCKVIAPAQSPHGPQNRDQVLAEFAKNKLAPSVSSEEVEVFEVNGVEIRAFHDVKKIPDCLGELTRNQEFDCILVGADDPTQQMLAAALEVAPDRVVLLARTTFYLPFGPVAALASNARAQQIQRVRAILCNSPYLADYFRTHLPARAGATAAPEIIHLPLPVIGLKIPEAPASPRFDRGFVTIINPSAIKGISIFLELAKRFPQVPFAAVPTWATTSEDRRALESVPNITILPATPQVDSIYAQTRVLLAPSLWDEAFGRVVVEAMLHGIPVVASNVGGLREAKLGIDYVAPVNPIQSYKDEYDEHRLAVPVVPPQDIAPWEEALREILTNSSRFQEISLKSRQAAVEFVSKADFADFERILSRVAAEAAENKKNRAKLIQQLTPAQRNALALKALATRKRAPSPEIISSPGAQNGNQSHEREAKIIEIWRSILKVRAVNRADNFFDLGGHSLLAIAMLAKLNEAFQVELPLGLFLENPTVAALAKALTTHSSEANNGFKTLVLLREGSGAEPLFLVHAHNGQALSNLPLARQIETPRPIYGFQSPSYNGNGHETSIEDLAARYLRDLKKLQPAGPYHLAGECFGGVLAFEIARQLIHRGDSVRYLGIIGASAPPVIQNLARRSPVARIFLQGVTRTHKELNLIVHSKPKELAVRYRHRLRYVNGLFNGKFGNPGSASTDASDLDDTAELNGVFRRATLQYQPDRYPGPVTLFRGQTQLLGSGRHGTLGWGPLVSGILTVHTMPGPNMFLLREPNRSAVARLIAGALQSSEPRRAPVPASVR